MTLMERMSGLDPMPPRVSGTQLTEAAPSSGEGGFPRRQRERGAGAGGPALTPLGHLRKSMGRPPSSIDHSGA